MQSNIPIIDQNKFIADYNKNILPCYQTAPEVLLKNITNHILENPDAILIFGILPRKSVSGHGNKFIFSLIKVNDSRQIYYGGDINEANF